MTRKVASLVTIGVVGVAGVVLSGHRVGGQQQTQVYPDVFSNVTHDTSPPLSEIGEKEEKGPKHTKEWLKPPHKGGSGQTDQATQNSAGPLVGTTAGLNFLGVGVGLAGFLPNAAPPDTNGAAGATQFVEWVNESFAVFSKSTGALVYGPAAGNTLWSGFGGPCETSNDGDIIAQYDKAAGRWVMAQPVFSSPYFYCIAVSATSDATGAYYRYQFPTPRNSFAFPDYPKLGVWPDAYYASFNLFWGGRFFVGAAACAFDRNAMLFGQSATVQCFTNGSASFLPSDLDGSTPPPAGSPDYFVDLATSSSLNLYQFHVDFTNSANSTFTGPTSIPVAAFNEACTGGTCIPQKGTTQQLDSLADRLMYRLAYRNFGDHEALVASHSVDPGNGTSAVRWYEIRSPASSPTVYQQGTYAPDSSYRWMPSIAMDKSGDIAVGYSVSSSSMFPAIRYTGRLPGDPLGTLQAENSIVEGGGSQSGSNLSRWGDYTSMAIDPVDDCTFWYSNEYEQSTGAFNWSTRIASFKFPSCGGAPTPDFTISATPASQTVVQGNSTSYTVNIGALNGFTGTVSFGASGLGSGASASFNPTTVTTSGSTTMTVATTSGAQTGTFTVTITGTSGALTHTVNVTLVVNAPGPPPDFTISATPSSQTVVQGFSTSFTATVTALNGFNEPVSFSASGLPSDASASFNPTSVTGSGSSTMTVTTLSTTPTGSFTLTITGTSGALSHSTTVTLVVTAASSGDFSISATPTSQTVSAGSSTSYTITVTASGGFGGTVSFSVSGLPPLTGGRFNPSSVVGEGSSTLTVGASRMADGGGPYTLTITGTSGNLSHTTTATLNVN